MSRLERATHWATLFIGIPAAVVGAVFTALQFFSRDGRPLPPLLTMLNSEWLAWLGQELLYCAILVGLVRLVAMGRTLKNEHDDREQQYQKWIADRGREISDRCISEYRTLERRVDDFAGVGTERLNRLVAEHDARVKTLVVTSATRERIAELVAEGDQLFGSLRQEVSDVRNTM